MRVSIGVIDVDDDTRKAIRRELGQKGLATRADVKSYVEGKIQEAFVNAGAPAAAAAPAAAEEPDEDTTEEAVAEEQYSTDS